MLFKNIIFFHENVNGDCFFSRLLVSKVIESTKNLDINYYYNSYRSLGSHCLDLGIKDDNFNIWPKKDLDYSKKHYIINENLFINVWVGIDNIDLYESCCLCMKKFINYYNYRINILNLDYNLNINLINKEIIESININYDYYNCNFLNKFINDNKIIYKKIILVYNNKITTFIGLNNIDHNYYIKTLSNKYIDFLFITFDETQLNSNNVISFSKIYEKYNIELPKCRGIQFSYLSILSDKVITLLSGCSQLCYHILNINQKNKFVLLYNSYNPANCPICPIINEDNYLCIEINNLYFNVIIIDNPFDNNYIINKIEHFILK
jgi:hypothetical protein